MTNCPNVHREALTIQTVLAELVKKSNHLYLQRPKDPRRCLQDAVDAIGNVKPVCPVVVGNRSVVFLHGYRKPHLVNGNQLF